MQSFESIEKAISDATGKTFQLLNSHPIGGGCIHSAKRIEGKDGRSYFLKSNRASAAALFEAEIYSLQMIDSTQTIRVPTPIVAGLADTIAFLVLEFLEMQSAGGSSLSEMGRQLARLHHSTSEKFGFCGDNFIGSSLQKNVWCSSWVEFYSECRLKPQLEMAARRGYRNPESETLLDHLSELIGRHNPVPSLVHGDLWAGNASVLNDGTPVVYDPASYYGDRETDMAFSHFFGGFSSGFYAAYSREWPLPDGHQKRIPVYNLYHALNHLNLFGDGYAASCDRLIEASLDAL